MNDLLLRLAEIIASSQGNQRVQEANRRCLERNLYQQLSIYTTSLTYRDDAGQFVCTNSFLCPMRWGCSSVGRAFALHVKGPGFEFLLLQFFFAHFELKKFSLYYTCWLDLKGLTALQ